MAEGWARELGPGWLEVRSAGLEAHGKNLRAIAVMAEAGVDISAQESTRVTEAMLQAAELVITVCGHADEHCPTLPAGSRKEHWPLDDPAKATGGEEQIMNIFRVSRDEIKQRVSELVNRLEAKRNSESVK